MGLVRKPAIIGKNLKARLATGRPPHRPATTESEERPPYTYLKHGFHYEGRDEALRTLGDDPAHLAELERVGREQWRPSNACQEWMVLRIAGLQLRIERASRMQRHLDGHQPSMTMQQVTQARKVLRRDIEEFSREIARETKSLMEMKRREAAGNGDQDSRRNKKANPNGRVEPTTAERIRHQQQRTQQKFAPVSNAGSTATRPKDVGPSGDRVERRGTGNQAEMFDVAPSSVCGPARSTPTGQLSN